MFTYFFVVSYFHALFGKYTQFYKFPHIGHSPWNQNAVLILTLACLSPSDTIATEPEQSSFPTEKTKAFNQVVCSPKALTVSMFSGCTCWHGQSHISSQHPPHLSSVDEFVDLCGGDSRNDQTYGHNGEAGQNFIPHDYSLKLSGDKEQLALRLPSTVYFANKLTKCRPSWRPMFQKRKMNNTSCQSFSK